MKENKDPAPRLRLKEAHPTALKIKKLCDLAAELGVSIRFDSHTVLVYDLDRDKNLPPLYLEDVEPLQKVGEFPPFFEYKLVYENPAYLELERQRQAEYRRVRTEERKLAEATEEEKKKEEQKRKKFEQEAAEKRRQKTLGQTSSYRKRTRTNRVIKLGDYTGS